MNIFQKMWVFKLIKLYVRQKSKSDTSVTLSKIMRFEQRFFAVWLIVFYCKSPKLQFWLRQFQFSAFMTIHIVEILMICHISNCSKNNSILKLKCPVMYNVIFFDFVHFLRSVDVINKWWVIPWNDKIFNVFGNMTDTKEIFRIKLNYILAIIEKRYIIYQNVLCWDRFVQFVQIFKITIVFL